MKTTLLKISFIFLFLSLMGAGCEKDDEIFELQIGDKNATIKKEVDGIEFKFCLLNEKGEPATVFNEGENFSFQFTIENNLDNPIIFDRSLLFAPGFFEVKNEQQSFGYPYKITGIDEIGEAAFSIPTGKSIIMEVLWIPKDDEWSKGFVNYKRDNLQNLPKGKYYTEFSHQFNFGSIKTDLLTFKINFEIK